jgi:hypothetical protein
MISSYRVSTFNEDAVLTRRLGLVERLVGNLDHGIEISFLEILFER